jgi:hypothetical protein
MKETMKESVNKLFELVDTHPEYFLKNLNTNSVDEGVKTFFKKREEYASNNKSSLLIEYNSIDMIYKMIKNNYSKYFIPGRIEELLSELKQLSKTDNEEEFHNLKNRIKILLLNIETQIATYVPNYKPKIEL